MAAGTEDRGAPASDPQPGASHQGPTALYCSQAERQTSPPILERKVADPALPTLCWAKRKVKLSCQASNRARTGPQFTRRVWNRPFERKGRTSLVPELSSLPQTRVWGHPQSHFLPNSAAVSTTPPSSLLESISDPQQQGIAAHSNRHSLCLRRPRAVSGSSLFKKISFTGTHCLILE